MSRRATRRARAAPAVVGLTTAFVATLVTAVLAIGWSPAARAATDMIEPTRVLDTRTGVGARAGRLDAGETLVLTLPSVATAALPVVFLNLTTVDASVGGFVTAWPCAAGRPDTSVVNFEPGRAVPNMVVLDYRAGGLCFASSSPVHLVADLTGVARDGDVVGIAPNRLLDTRGGAPLSPFVERRVPFAGTRGVAADAMSAAVNVTVVAPSGDGFVIVKPCGSATNASTVNFRAGEVVAHMTFVALSSGALCVVSSAATEVLVDAFGFMRSGSIRSLNPARLLDTRSGLGAPAGRLASGSTTRLQVTGRGNVPPRAIGATVNVVAVDGRGDGFVTIWSCDGSAPEASTINVWPGITRSNQATIALDGAGMMCIRPSTANGSSIDVVLDVVGYVAGPNTPEPGPTTTTTLAPPVGRFETLPVGAALPSGADCAARARPAAEVRAENAAPNANRGGRQYANTRNDWAGFARVDGDFAGTTDEIIQWAACKWGIDEDIARAQIVKESYWKMSTVGDNGESFGVGQVRVPFHGSAFQYPQVNARNSTAYNLDYTYAVWRACYEGVYTWLNTVERGRDYAAGDVWGCLGLWFSGRWYVNIDAYLDTPGDSVRWHYQNRTWQTATFING
jgi:hypothetical protein